MSEGKGCNVIAVALVALLMLVVGVAAGGATVWFLYVQDAPAVTEPANPPTTTPPVTANPPVETQRYAALLPLEETLRVQGPLPPDEVKKALLGGKRFKLRDCYQKGVEKNPELKGEMSLQFTVAGSNGKVTAAIERHTDFADKSVRDCILAEVKSWEFPPPKQQSTVFFDVLMMSMSGQEAQ